MKKDIMILKNGGIQFISENEISNYDVVVNKENLPIETLLKHYGGDILTHINQTPEICLEAVKYDGLALSYVKEQTPEICLEAVKQNPFALQYVKEQTEKICLESVKKNPWVLQYVKNQTPKICLVAVKQNPWTIEYVKEQTTKICMYAINKNYCVISKITEEYQTYEICLEAVKYDIRSLMCIYDTEIRDKIINELNLINSTSNIVNINKYR